jgi:hypothetical protein
MGFGAALLAAIVELVTGAGAAVDESLEHAERPRTATAVRPATEIA